jgi:4-amino-4-deoxy-L-arabinose transferase-like glycosyltransferase
MIRKIGEYYRKPRVKEVFLISLIVALNLIIKLIPASVLELGNDEVYYWTYALFPDWSHFDHPPMVGLTIQLFSLNLTYQSELALRLGSLVLSTLDILILYFLVKKLYSWQAAFISILLFTSSVYFNVLCGLLILPDSPLIFFILLALYFGLPSIINHDPGKNDDIRLLLFGFFTGLAFLSKYHALFLWLGFGLYIIFHNRTWLKKPSLYLSILITLLLMLPVLYWNVKNNFISFTFHENRIGLLHSHINLKSFIQFNLGQFLYQNPVLFIVFILALISVWRKKDKITRINLLLIYLSLPLIFIVTLFSVFRSSVLPHWTGPVFICLIIISSEWLSDMYILKKKRVISIILFSNLLCFLFIGASTIQIKYGIILSASRDSDPSSLGHNDYTLDMFGWHQAATGFTQFLTKEKIPASDYSNVKIITSEWFPAAHLDFYIAHPLKIDVLVPRNLGAAHKYFWINNTRHIQQGNKIFFVTSSQHYFPPEGFKPIFSEIIPKDTLQIKRNGIPVKNLFIYEMKGLRMDSINKY